MEQKTFVIKIKNIENKFNFTVIIFQKKGQLFNEFLRNGINV